MNNHDRLSIISTYNSKPGDDTTILDSSTVPTYEEFARKKINKNIIEKIKYLNSTQNFEPSSIFTDDESDNEEKFNYNNNKKQDVYFTKASNEKLRLAFESIQIQSHSPNLNSKKLSKERITNNYFNNKKASIDEEEYEYVTHEHKEIQTSFVTDTNNLNTSNENVNEKISSSSSNENLNLHLSKSVINDKKANNELENVDIISETIIESPSPVQQQPVPKTPSLKSQLLFKDGLLTTPIRLTESSSICPKSFIKYNEDKSPKLIKIGSNTNSNSNSEIKIIKADSPNIITTYEKHRINEKNIVVINHQLNKKDLKTSKTKKRVSMCAEDLPQDVVEHNLDEDENRLDVTRGNIVTLELINENDKENEYIEEEKSIEKENEIHNSNQENQINARKIVSKISSDSESNDEAFEKFLQQYKPPMQQINEENEKKNVKNKLKDFIVNDNYISSNSTTDEANHEETASTSSSDEQVFYIKTTQKLINKKIVNKPDFKNIRTNNKLDINTSSSSEKENESDEEYDNSFVSSSSSSSSNSPTTSNRYETPIKNKRNMNESPIRRKNSESALETVFRTPNQAKTKYDNIHFRTEVKKIPISKQIKKIGFIESLSSNIPDDQRHPEAMEFCKKFTNKKVKDELLKKVYHLFNEAVFDGKLPPDMKLLWNNRLTSTAGMCKYRTEDGKPVAEIHISTKVCDTAERLRDTCVHEMCHSAVYLFHGCKNEGHGRLWQYWAHKVTDVFKNIPKVTTSHNYAINKKFIYKCKDCGQEIHRFQKSIDIEKNVCGRCHGHFVLLHNDKKQQEKQKNLINDKLIFGTSNTNINEFELQIQAQTPRKLNTFAQFVKENYSSVKMEKKLNSHKDVMQEISKKFKLLSTK